MERFTYPSKKMSVEEYREAKKTQFGAIFPEIEAKCLYCDQIYGKHYGLECPETQDIGQSGGAAHRSN